MKRKTSHQLKPDRLLAKSVEDGWRGSYSLVGHTADVVRAVTLLVDTLGDRLIEQFDLSCDLDTLKKTARLAAYLHDWGKANNHFQGVVRNKMDDAQPQRNPMENPQLLRHEILSVLLAWEFREWLQQADGDFMTALAVAGGHHLKIGGKGGAKTNEVGEIRCGCGDDRMTFYLNHPNFKGLLRFGIRELGCPAKVQLSRKPIVDWTTDRIKTQREEILLNGFCDWEPQPILTAILKALLVSSDAVGSAIATTNIKLDDWIKNAIRCTSTEGDEKKKCRTLTLEDLDRVIQARLKGNELRDFQEKLGNIQTRVGLARAGCGTGKTLGAYNWAKRHAIDRKLFVCYPTTGTSTEGFLDYIHKEIPESELMHSRKDVDLEIAGILHTGEEAEAGDGTENEEEMKLDSFRAWKSKIVVCTVDTVLGLLQCHRRSLYSFPAIANAAFVFDEVHCYDKSLFGALLRFLETVKAPTLLMSASFLPSQLEAIERAIGEPLTIVEGPKELETQPRYRFHYADNPDWGRVEAELSAGGKVLWVCNQVNTAISVYEEAQKRGLKNVLLYHSRYRYQNRVEHHRQVVDAFKGDRSEPVLAIATQVAEMSLDLSATLLVTQIADPAGLIQRLGRLNRRYCGRALDALFYPDPKDKPYPKNVLDRGLAMVQAFPGDVSQADLAEWLKGQESPFKPDCQSVWLDGKWRTYPASLREAGFNLTCVLEEDLDTIKKDKSNQLPRYTVPLFIPNSRASKVKDWSKHRGYPVAPKKEWSYCPKKGAVAIKKLKGGDVK